jgi:hypothetical protein
MFRKVRRSIVSPEFNLRLGAARTPALPHMYVVTPVLPANEQLGKPFNIISNSSI